MTKLDEWIEMTSHGIPEQDDLVKERDTACRIAKHLLEAVMHYSSNNKLMWSYNNISPDEADIAMREAQKEIER